MKNLTNKIDRAFIIQKGIHRTFMFGERIELKQYPGVNDNKGIGLVEFSMNCLFKNVPGKYVNYNKTLKEMRNQYPDFNDDTPVTLTVYRKLDIKFGKPFDWIHNVINVGD